MTVDQHILAASRLVASSVFLPDDLTGRGKQYTWGFSHRWKVSYRCAAAPPVLALRCPRNCQDTIIGTPGSYPSLALMSHHPTCELSSPRLPKRGPWVGQLVIDSKAWGPKILRAEASKTTRMGLMARLNKTPRDPIKTLFSLTGLCHMARVNIHH